MAWTLCTSGSAIHEAGANVNAAIAANATALADYSDEAEAAICAMVPYDVVTNFSSLTAQGKKIFQQLAAKMVAQQMIKYDMSGFTSIGEATQMLNVLENDIARAVGIVTADNNRKYLGISA